MAITYDHSSSFPTTGFAAGFKRFIANVQVGRMRSVLNQMSDSQLETVGITRSEIDAYAAKLVKG